MWKPLGVNVELQNMEWKAYVAAKGTGDYQLARSWAFGDYPEPSALLEAFTCDHTANESGFCNPEYDELLQQASKTEDQANRFALYQHAESILNESAAVMPLYHYNHTRLVRNTLKGFPNNNPKGNIYAKDLYFIQQ
ncbi:murein tripeptide ABC transporter periplasmic binding protein (fragment) [Vibrio chagasii]|jgi:oligopeptide transport system substrate-binding protein